MYNITASKEVILSAGAIGSAQLLQVSGIGNAADLSAKGIKTKYNNPNVGLNFAVRPFSPTIIDNATKAKGIWYTIFDFVGSSVGSKVREHALYPAGRR